jgi:hypothetical protein
MIFISDVWDSDVAIMPLQSAQLVPNKHSIANSNSLFGLAHPLHRVIGAGLRPASLSRVWGPRLTLLEIFWRFLLDWAGDRRAWALMHSPLAVHRAEPR